MERVVLAVGDGDDAAAGAPWWTLQRSRETPLRVELVHVIRAERDRAEATRRLDRLKRGMLARAPHVMVTESVVAGDPRRVLRRETQGADLLVLGTGRRGSRPRFRLRGLAVRLLEDAPTTTVLVPDGWGPAARGPVLAAVAPNAASARAVVIGARDAARAGVDLQLAHAWEADPAVAPEHAGRAAHRRVLDDAVQHVHDEVPEARVVPLLEEGEVDEVLTELARHARLVVIGGRTRARGSAAVARRLLTRTRTPLCVVPAAAG